MSIIQHVRDEVKRGPLALALNTTLAVIAIVSLVVALRQPIPGSYVGSATAQSVPTKSSYSIWLTIAVYLSVTGVGAAGARLLYRANAWVGVLFSLVLAVLSLFLTTWAAQHLGLDVSKTEPGKAFSNLIFSGTLVIYLAVAGGEALLNFGRSGRTIADSKDASSGTEDAVGTVASLALVIGLWGWIVGAGQTAAVKAFL